MFEIVINQLQHYGTDFRSMGLSWSVALCKVPKLFLVLAAPTLCSIFSKIDVNFLTLFFTYSIVIYFMCCTTVNKLECFFFRTYISLYRLFRSRLLEKGHSSKLWLSRVTPHSHKLLSVRPHLNRFHFVCSVIVYSVWRPSMGIIFF